MYSKQELQWIQEFIDTRFDGIDASEEMIGLMEKSGLLKQSEKTTVDSIKSQKSLLTKEVYSDGILLTEENII